MSAAQDLKPTSPVVPIRLGLDDEFRARRRGQSVRRPDSRASVLLAVPDGGV